MSGKKIGYRRVSTVDQNTARQLDGIELDKAFEDKCSGRTFDRPKLKECLDYLREDDTLYVHSIDRLGRNIRELLNHIDAILAKGVNIVFVKEQMAFDPSRKANPTQMLYLAVLAAVADFEVAMIRERQREGIALAKQRNAYQNCGRKPVLGKEQIEEIRRRHSGGEGATALAREYGCSRSTVYSVLKAS
jgi:DNA invertase Pin-like site-specific DNA recombinase